MYLNNNRSLGTESEKRKKLDTAERRVSKARRRGRRMMISVRGVDGDAWLTKCPLSRAPCPGSAAIVGGEAGMSLPPRALYGRASAYDGIAVTLDDSIHRDYVLDNVCFVQTWLPTPHPPSPNPIDLIKRSANGMSDYDSHFFLSFFFSRSFVYESYIVYLYGIIIKREHLRSSWKINTVAESTRRTVGSNNNS